MSGDKKKTETPRSTDTTVGLAKEQGKIGSRCVAPTFPFRPGTDAVLHCSEEEEL